MKKNPKKQEDKSPESEDAPGYPLYLANDDIYSKDEKETFNETEDSLDEELDVPGAELDDAEELIGGEDEENNYYSLGGDDHNDLDESE
jgi:hypothetical protein